MSFKISNTTVLDSDFSSAVTTITAERLAFPVSAKPFEGIGANTTHGYIAGGRSSNPPSNSQSLLGQRFPFAVDEASVSLGSDTANYVYQTNRELVASMASTTHGYSCGGSYPYSATNDEIEKYNLASSGGGSDVGDLTRSVRRAGGHNSTTHGYATGGSPSEPVSVSNIIEKFPFATDENATDVGDLAASFFDVAGTSSGEHGYVIGGRTLPPVYGVTRLERFPFASDDNASDIGDLVKGHGVSADGVASATHGYACGGYKDPSPGADANMNEIQRFSFASSAACVDTGNLTDGRFGLGGHSSPTHGYTTGGWMPTLSSAIDKFPFSKDDNATDVAEMTQSRYGHGSTQG